MLLGLRRFLGVAILSAVTSMNVGAQITEKQYIDINNSWKFFAGAQSSGQSTSLSDGSWSSVTLPHTWNGIDGQDGNGDYRRGDGWYRKQVDIPSSASGKRVYLDVAAACMTSTVYVNGNQVGEHIGGYGRFVFDITSKVTAGQKALVAIKVNNEDVVAPPRHADFTFSGGLHRGVRLIVANPLHIAPTNTIAKNSYLVNGSANIASPGVKIRQYNVSSSSAKIDVTTRVRNSNGSAQSTTAVVTVYDRQGNKVVEAQKTQNVNANADADLTQTLTINNPHLWNGTKDPYLYSAVITLKQGNTVVDRSVQPLGLRYYSIDKASGFKLNGQSYPLRGFAFHDELMDKGRATTDADRLRDLEIIRNAGVNYVRISHYQHGDYTYNYCDSVGIICWTEIPTIDYMSNATAQNTFQQNAATQLYELIRQQYNHPSVMFWGLANEIRQSNKGADVPAVITALNNLAHDEDNTRKTSIAMDKVGNDNFTSYAELQIPDLLAVNKYCGWYEGSRGSIASTFESRLKAVYDNSKIPVAMSEYGAGGSPFQHNSSDTGGEGNGKENHPEEFQAYSHEQHWSIIQKTNYFWATSCWAAFDFASDGRAEGDEAGINDKGLVTHDRGVKKDAYFVYQANLANYGVVHIKSRRYLKPGSSVTVKAYSNCSNLQMRINNGSWQNMATDNSAIKLYKKENVTLSNGANVVEVQGTYNGKTITDVAVWYVGTAGNSPEVESGNGGNVVSDEKASGGKHVELPAGTSHTVNYNAPAEGTYTMQIYYLTKVRRGMKVTANGYSATHYFGETGAWTAGDAGRQGIRGNERRVVINVYLKKGANAITFSTVDGAAPNLDYLTFYYYHPGTPVLEDNPIQQLVAIPNNPNPSVNVSEEQPVEVNTDNMFYLQNVGTGQWIKTGGLAKTPDSPALTNQSNRTANIIEKQKDGTYTIADPEFYPQAWGIQGRNTIYESNNGSVKTNSWGTTLIPGFKFVSTGDNDGSVYIEYTWGQWTKGSLNITDPSNKTYVLYYGDWALGTDGWNDAQKAEVAGKGVWSDLKENAASHGADAKWLIVPVANGTVEVQPAEKVPEVIPETPKNVSISIPSYGQSTYSSAYDLDFTGSGLDAYVAAGYNAKNGSLLLSHVDVVPAGTGVLLIGSKNTTYQIPVVNKTSWVYGNLFVGVVTAKTVSESNDGYVNYYMSNTGSNGSGFYRINAPVSFGDNRAYLSVPASLFAGSPARYINYEFDDDVTGIKTVDHVSDRQDDRCFDLQGRRIAQPKKGIYLISGHKMLIKK